MVLSCMRQPRGICQACLHRELFPCKQLAVRAECFPVLSNRVWRGRGSPWEEIQKWFSIFLSLLILCKQDHCLAGSRGRMKGPVRDTGQSLSSFSFPSGLLPLPVGLSYKTSCDNKWNCYFFSYLKSLAASGPDSSHECYCMVRALL